MPDRSWSPLITAFGIVFLALGLLFSRTVNELGELDRSYNMAIAGGGVFILGVIMWALEGPGGYHLFPKEEEE